LSSPLANSIVPRTDCIFSEMNSEKIFLKNLVKIAIIANFAKWQS